MLTYQSLCSNFNHSSDWLNLIGSLSLRKRGEKVCWPSPKSSCKNMFHSNICKHFDNHSHTKMSSSCKSIFFFFLIKCKSILLTSYQSHNWIKKKLFHFFFFFFNWGLTFTHNWISKIKRWRKVFIFLDFIK